MMRFTSPQRRLIWEAKKKKGLSRRELLKWAGKAAGAIVGGPVEKLAKFVGPRTLVPSTFEVEFEPFAAEANFSSFSDWLNNFIRMTKTIKSFADSPLYDYHVSRSSLAVSAYLGRDSFINFLDWAKRNGCKIENIKDQLNEIMAERGSDFVPNVIKTRYQYGGWRVTFPNGQVLNIDPTMTLLDRKWVLDSRLGPDNTPPPPGAKWSWKPQERITNPLEHVLRSLSNIFSNYISKYQQGRWSHGINQLIDDIGGLPSLEDLKALNDLGIDVPPQLRDQIGEVYRLAQAEKEKELHRKGPVPPKVRFKTPYEFGDTKDELARHSYSKHEFIPSPFEDKLKDKLEAISEVNSPKLGKASRLISKASNMINRMAKRLISLAKRKFEIVSFSDYDEKSRRAEIRIQFGRSDLYPASAVSRILIYDMNDINFVFPKRFAKAFNQGEEISKFKSESAAQNFLKRLANKLS